MSAIASSSATNPQPCAHRNPRAARPPSDPLGGLDRRLQSWLGVDLRLIYGTGVPMVCVVAATIAMFKHPTYVLVGSILVFELLCLALVLTKVFAMLDEPDAAAR
jgi:hypothetical protein